MRRLLHLGLLLSLSLTCATPAVQAQSCPNHYAQIVAANLGANTPLSTGALTIIATDASHQPINYSVVGVGVGLTKPWHGVVVNGAITSPSPLCIPRSDQSSVPLGYHFILRDTSAQGGNAVVMDVQDVAVTTSIWSLDDYPFAPSTNPYTLAPYVPPAATVSLGTTTILPPGSTPTLTISGPPTAAVLNFGISPGPPISFKGPWSSTMTYALGDAVSFTNGASYISLAASNLNHNPSTDTTNWGVLVAKGADGVASLPQLSNLRSRGLVTANLFNSAAAQSGYYLNPDGSLGGGGSYPNVFVSDYIPANAGGNMVANFPLFANGGTGAAFYDGNYNFVSTSSAGSAAAGTPISIPTGAAFVRFGGSVITSPSTLTVSATLAAAMVAYGSTVPPSYVAPGTYPSNVIDSMIGALQTPVAEASSAGASLLATGRNPNLIGPEIMTYGNYLNIDGTVNGSSFASYQYSSCVPVAGNTTYTIGFPNVPWIPTQPAFTLNAFGGALFLIFDASGTVIDVGQPGANPNPGIIVLPSGGLPNPYTFTTPATASCMKFSGNNLTYAYNGSWVSGNAWTPDRVLLNNNSTSVMMIRGTSLPNYYLPYGKAASDYNPAYLTKHIGLLADSIWSNFGVGWEAVLWGRYNPIKQLQEARPGRDFAHAFECFQTITPGATLGTYDAGVAMSATSGCAQGGYLQSGQTTGGLNWGGEALGQNFAQVVAPLDILAIGLGTNNLATPIGTLGDSISTNSVYGNLRWIGETAHTANPNMTVLWVTPRQRFDGPGCTDSGTNATQLAIVAAEVAYAKSVGDPYVDMSQEDGVSAITCATKTRGDGIHPSDSDFLNGFGPVIANRIAALL